jgi:hypothetical protein
MVQFKTVIQKFEKQGEKTGWTHIIIPPDIAQQIFPNNKKTFRVKGKLDDYAVKAVALMPMGDGSFVMPFNASIRKEIHKKNGATVMVALELDDQKIPPPEELIECLQDEPKAWEFYNQLSKSHQNYYCNYIRQAKTDATKSKRIAQSVNALSKGWHYGIMIRELKENRTDF